MTARKRFIVIALSFLWAILCWTSSSYAFVAYETSPGVIELRAQNDEGLVITDAQVRTTRNKKSWVYFCLSEKRGPRGITQKEKCFYGNAKVYQNAKVGLTFRSIEYGLQSRIKNKSGLIRFADSRYFYPVHVLYEMN